mmetsp:Transcript_118016/g.367687  ORF Transcript_118016/g.367687 Transcript_118016/m.367687 type:complete len:208 (+) Transcript_118016:41-664(+)
MPRLGSAETGAAARARRRCLGNKGILTLNNSDEFCAPAAQISGCSTGGSFVSAQLHTSKSLSNIRCRACCTWSSFRSPATSWLRSSILSSFLLSFASCFVFTATALSILSSARRSSCEVSNMKLPFSPASSSKNLISSGSFTAEGSKATTLMGSTGSFLEGGFLVCRSSRTSSRTSSSLPCGRRETQRKMREGRGTPSCVNLLSMPK